MISLEGVLEFSLGMTTNLIGLFLLVMIFHFSYKTFSINNRSNRFFYLLMLVSGMEMITHLVICVMQYITNYGFWGIDEVGVVAYSIVFTVNSLYLYVWVLYLIDKFKYTSATVVGYRKKVILATLPIVVLFVLSIVNMFVPVFISFKGGIYDRKVLYDLNLLVPIAYLLVGGFKFLKSDRKRRTYQEIPFCQLLLPIVLAHVLEFFFIGLCVIPIGNTIAIFLLVLNNVKLNSSVDGLTELYTRRELYNYLESVIGLKRHNKKIIGIIFDLDRFKQINDTYGHQVGDDALSDFGFILKSSIPNNAIAYRYAGDEFIVIASLAKQEEAQQIVEGVYTELERFNANGGRVYKLHTSYGISTLEENDTVSEFIERMDLKMYENKQRNRSEGRKDIR